MDVRLCFDQPRPIARLPVSSADQLDHIMLVDPTAALFQSADTFLGTGLPQPPDDLKCCVGFARAGRHDQ